VPSRLDPLLESDLFTAAGKGGAIAFMRHLAIENARTGVTANILNPGAGAHPPRHSLGMPDAAAGRPGANRLLRLPDLQPAAGDPAVGLLPLRHGELLLALRLGLPPAGFGNWSLRLLAERVVELQIAPSISHETVRRTLKKTA